MSFKTIFPTGGTGILGSELMRAFSDAGYEIRALVRHELSRERPKPVEFVLARIMGRQPQTTPSSVRMMYQDRACDSSRARAELG